MVSSDVEICNQALLLLREDTINSFDEGTPRAKLAEGFYSSSRDALLRMHPWNFAVKRILLAPDAEAPAWGYSAAFTIPLECLRIIEVNGITDYKIEGRKILCDSTGLSIKYVFRNEDVNEYDALFIDALAAYLAFKMAPALTGSNDTKKFMFDTFKSILPMAKNIDAQEEPQDTIGDFPFIDVRSR